MISFSGSKPSLPSGNTDILRKLNVFSMKLLLLIASYFLFAFVRWKKIFVIDLELDLKVNRKADELNIIINTSY